MRKITELASSVPFAFHFFLFGSRVTEYAPVCERGITPEDTRYGMCIMKNRMIATADKENSWTSPPPSAR